MATKKGAGAPAPLDPKTADQLLDLLGRDNTFRRLFKKDPAAALAQLGYRLPIGARIGCYGVTRIAPKREMVAARERLKAYLTSSLAPTNPHCFEAGEVSTALKRVKY